MDFQDIQEHFSLDLDCSRPESGGVVLPPIQCPLGPEEMAGLRAAIHPLSPSFDNGRDLYERVLNYIIVHSVTQQNPLS